MMRTLVAAAALAALVTTATAASATARNPKPGEYAQNSKVYAEYIANCRRAATTSPKVEDEAARKLEKLSAAERKQQIDACRMNEAALAKKAPRREASNLRHGPGRLSSRDLENLEGLAQKALGPVPADARGYTARVTRRVGAPTRACVQVRDARPGRGTLVRWRCPPGTIKRLGW